MKTGNQEQSELLKLEGMKIQTKPTKAADWAYVYRIQNVSLSVLSSFIMYNVL